MQYSRNFISTSVVALVLLTASHITYAVDYIDSNLTFRQQFIHQCIGQQHWDIPRISQQQQAKQKTDIEILTQSCKRAAYQIYPTQFKTVL